MSFLDIPKPSTKWNQRFLHCHEKVKQAKQAKRMQLEKRVHDLAQFRQSLVRSDCVQVHCWYLGHACVVDQEGSYPESLEISTSEV
jgi:hypothetical protein